MMDILDALEKSKLLGYKEPKDDHVKDAVFYASLYRLGREDHKDCPREERAELLTYLEQEHDRKLAN